MSKNIEYHCDLCSEEMSWRGYTVVIGVARVGEDIEGWSSFKDLSYEYRCITQVDLCKECLKSYVQHRSRGNGFVFVPKAKFGKAFFNLINRAFKKS